MPIVTHLVCDVCHRDIIDKSQVCLVSAENRSRELACICVITRETSSPSYIKPGESILCKTCSEKFAEKLSEYLGELNIEIQ